MNVDWPEVWQQFRDGLQVAWQIGLAAGLAGIVGWERETQEKPAGFRTFMLVGLGSAAFTLVTMQLYDQVDSQGGRYAADPIRIVSGVIGGLGFLGAGSIIHSGSNIRGITTAATIWVTGSIGVACGLGYYTIAIATVAFSYAVLRLGLVAETKKPR